MAKTLIPDIEFEKFNKLKETQGTRFRLTPRNSVTILIFAGLIPAGLTYFAYATEGKFHWNRLYRKGPLNQVNYVPRDKDL
ncbi:uncharacterized protein SPAPADRAFT_135701 [Spathaspora passalidarum NRRL Y-27907]|uniref:Uncharacterized protein n=1 Tax=Spathaspora passalidarum (strain NRRL Y-27907 / 11-Y1) TaxID=619300 RepID=G3AM62_SPAPN|nr:uncharacterized protein SPAPADRAFT_135701 [Spathaspora passalidarum NRRL Y-27907]EGW32767.1 hypothetical protein SPAPADRAFT_135701 [Spathaspora passalidarum NRRL Y-27907]